MKLSSFSFVIKQETFIIRTPFPGNYRVHGLKLENKDAEMFEINKGNVDGSIPTERKLSHIIYGLQR